jgi:hypothetical protein
MKKVFFLLLISSFAYSRVPSSMDINTPPKRIIRTCCSFGVDVKVSLMPFVKVSDITSIDALGKHKYLGEKDENNGIIYTRNGGFIDIGHLRDIADYTAYLYALIQENRKSGVVDFKLGKEAGLKRISFTIPERFNDEDIANLAGRIAYDLSVWHEISTWYGSSYIPFVPERYSSFSVEDAYSNLLGVHLGIKSILSENDYEEEMTKNIMESLHSLVAVSSLEQTREAMNEVKDIWWSGTAKFPSRKVLIKRQFEILDKVSPLVLDADLKGDPEYDLLVPNRSSTGDQLNDIYSLEIKANFKIPVKRVFGHNFKDRFINQNDFPALIHYAEILAQEENQTTESK